MFRLIKKILMTVLISTASLFVLTDSTKCVSLKNQECKAREVITQEIHGLSIKYQSKQMQWELNNSTSL